MLLSFAGARGLARIFEQRGNPSDCRGGAIGRQDLSALRCLLEVFDAAATVLADWSEVDAEAARWGIEIRGLSREDLSALIEGSTFEIPTTEHRRLHQEASDFVRWGRRGAKVP
jgi:hypothetical protein